MCSWGPNPDGSLSQQRSQQLGVVWCPPACDGVPGWCSTETLTLDLLIQTAQVAAFSHLQTQIHKGLKGVSLHRNTPNG